jgi:hypothetical protein
MRFADVKVGQAFDFPETGFLGCIKTSPKGYLYDSNGSYYRARVGTVGVSVSNVRDAYAWELELAGVPSLADSAAP